MLTSADLRQSRIDAYVEAGFAPCDNDEFADVPWLVARYDAAINMSLSGKAGFIVAKELDGEVRIEALTASGVEIASARFTDSPAGHAMLTAAALALWETL